MKKVLANGALLLACLCSPALAAAQSDHVITVVLATGKESTIETPFSNVRLDCGDFTLESDLDLIDRIVPTSSGLEVFFNNGESLRAQRLSGEISYQGEFGKAKLPWTAVERMTTVRNARKQRATGSFDRGYFKFTTTLLFESGSTRVVHLSLRDLSLGVMYKGMTGAAWPSRTSLDFDWSRQTVIAWAPGFQKTELAVRLPLQTNAEAQTDLGRISFAWRALVHSRPSTAGSEFNGEYRVRLVDESTLTISNISHLCRDSSRRPCLSLDGRAAEEVFWENVSSVRLPDSQAVAVAAVRFTDGKESKATGDTLRGEWPVGEIEIPLSGAVLSELERIALRPKADSKEHTQRIRFKDGLEWIGRLEQLHGFETTTAPGVLRLVGIPVPIGTWLAESDVLALSISETGMFVAVLGRTYRVPQADLERMFQVRTLYGRFSVPLKEVGSVQPIAASTAAPTESAVFVVLNNGEKQELTSTKIQFVRYPDRIWSGTMYNPALGAWYWRREDFITVTSDGATTDVDLNRLRRLRISGVYPSWDVEIEAPTGAILKGRVKPGEIAAKSPGVSSWNQQKEGFWLSSPAGRAFLFIPAAAVAEITVSAGSR